MYPDKDCQVAVFDSLAVRLFINTVYSTESEECAALKAVYKFELGNDLFGLES